jgi:hypothetical protein
MAHIAINTALIEASAVLGGHTGGVLSASFGPDDRDVVTASEDKTARIWNYERREVTASGQELVDEAKRILPRCLSTAERRKGPLDREPLAWCIEMRKWPYLSRDWQDWLKYKRTHADVPLPDSAEWEPWIAARH